MQEGNLEALKCPSCGEVLNEEDILKITGEKESIEKLHLILAQRWLSTQEDKKHCQTTDCPFVYIFEKECEQGFPRITAQHVIKHIVPTVEKITLKLTPAKDVYLLKQEGGFTTTYAFALNVIKLSKKTAAAIMCIAHNADCISALTV